MAAPENTPQQRSLTASPESAIPISPWEVLFLSSAADLLLHLAQHRHGLESPGEADPGDPGPELK
jgi:hypothetical protein